MPVTPKLLGNLRATTTNSTVYTVPASTTTIIKQITLCTNDSAYSGYDRVYPNVSIDLHHVPSAGTAATSNLFLRYVVQYGVANLIDTDIVMTAGEFISIKATVGNMMDIILYGVEST